MTSPWDPYRVLGISRDATKSEIKAAFRRLSLECHPDLNKDPKAESKFVQLNRAYTFLTKSSGHQGPSTTMGAQFYRTAKPKASNGILAGVLVGPLVMLGFYLSKNRKGSAGASENETLRSRPYGFWYPPVNEYLRDDLRPTQKERRW